MFTSTYLRNTSHDFSHIQPLMPIPEAKRIAVKLPIPPPPLPYAWEIEAREFSKELADRFNIHPQQRPSLTSLTKFFTSIWKDIDSLPFGNPRILKLLSLLDTPLRTNECASLQKKLTFQDKTYLLNAACFTSGDFKGSNVIPAPVDPQCYKSLRLTLDSADEKESIERRFCVIIYLSNYHGEWHYVHADSKLSGSKIKDLLCKISRTFLTHAVLSDKANLPLGEDQTKKYHYSILSEHTVNQSENAHFFTLSNWLLFASETPHTFYSSCGFSISNPQNDNIVLRDDDYKSKRLIRYSLDAYKAAIKYVREISTQVFKKALTSPEDIAKFEKLTKLHSCEGESFTVLCQKVNKASNEYHKVFLNMLINALRPLDVKRHAENGYIWLALKVIKFHTVQIAKAPFKPVNLEESASNFPQLIEQIMGESNDSLFCFYSENYTNRYEARPYIEIEQHT